MSYHHCFHISPASNEGHNINDQKAIGDKGIGQRLDKFLCEYVPDLTRTRIKALIESGSIFMGSFKDTAPLDIEEDLGDPKDSFEFPPFQFKGDISKVDLKPCTQPSKKLKAGDVIAFDIPEVEEANPEPQDMNLDVVFEDEDVIVINKPAGLVVHPGAGNPSGTLINGLLHHCGASLSGIGGVARPGIVHRLDKGTSGLMVVAKNDAAHQFLSEQFSHRSIKRTYFALCWGIPNPIEGKIEGNIGRDPRHRQRMKVLGHGGKPAITNYYLHEKIGLYASFIECNLETGRTHQIRVHMTHKGCSLLGDPLYGRTPRGVDQETKDAIKLYCDEGNRPMLHAGRLSFIHPSTKETVSFEADLPQDFEDMYTWLKTNT